MDTVKVAVIEDDPVWIKSIVSFLGKYNEFQVVGVGSNVNRALELVNEVQVDVILLDINLEGNKYDGIQLAFDILKTCKSIKIIMLSSLKDKEIISKSFLAGAADFIAKEDYLLIPNAIKMSLQKEFSYTDILSAELLKLKKLEFLHQLSPSEMEVFELFEMGLSNSQIEEKLHKSKETIKSQVRSILKKLGYKSLREVFKNLKQDVLEINK